MAAPPNLPVPKGWKPPPGVQKASKAFLPKPAPPPRPTGPGYGVLRPGVTSAPARGVTRRSVFNQPLSSVTRQNMRTGGGLQKLAPWKPSQTEVNKGVQKLRAEGRVQATKPKPGGGLLGTITSGVALGGKILQAGEALARGPAGLVGAWLTKGFNPVEAAKNLPESASRNIVGLPGAFYQTGKGVKEAFEGQPGKLEEMGKTLGQQLKEPGKFASKEPGAALLLAGGPETALAKGLSLGVKGVEAGARAGEISARAAGAEQRAAQFGALATKAGKVTSRERAPIHYYGNVYKHHEYSDLIDRKGLQVLADKVRNHILKADPNRTTGLAIHNNSITALQKWMRKRYEAGGITKPGRVDIEMGKGRTMQKMVNSQDEHLLRINRPKTFHARENMGNFYEGYFRRAETAREDATKRLNNLKKEHDALPRDKRTLNKAQQARIEKFLQLTDKQIQELESHTRVVARQYEPKGKDQVNLHILEQNQLHGALVPFALEHGHLLEEMFPGVYKGALHYEENPGIHPAVTRYKSELNRNKTLKEIIQKLRYEIKGAHYPKGVKTGKHFRLDNLKGELADSSTILRGLYKDIQNMKKNKLIEADGKMYSHLQDSTGKLVHTEHLQDLWNRETNFRPVGYISHKDTPIETRNVTTGSQRAGSLIRSRTGINAKSGAYDNSYNAIVRQFRKANRNIVSHLNENQLAAHMGIGGRDGLFSHKDNAKTVAEEMTHATGIQHVVRSVGPDKILGRTHIPASSGLRILDEHGMSELRMLHEADPYGKWAVMPKHVSDRIDSHVARGQPRTGERAWQHWTNWFRHANLFTSVRWPVGVNQENAIRAIAHNMSPFTLWKWSRNSPFLSGFSPKVWDALESEYRRVISDPTVSTAEKVIAHQHLAAVGLGNMYGANLSGPLEAAWRDLTPSEKVAYSEVFKSYQGVRQTLATWEFYKRAVLGRSLQKMETNVRGATVGKLAMEQQKGFVNKWRLMVNRQDKLVKEYVKGTLDPNKAAKWTEDLFDVVGNWNHLTPSLRFGQSTIAPFILWLTNSYKFVLKTMPWDHPMKTAVMAALVQATGANEAGKGLPEWAQGNLSIKLPIVGEIEANPLHYSPGDIAREPPGRFTEMFVPQVTQPYLETKGLSSFGKETKAPWPVRAGRPVEMGAIGSVPFARLGVEALRGGAKPNEASLNPVATKGEGRGAVKTFAKLFSPIPFTYPKGEKGKKGGLKLPKLETQKVELPKLSLPKIE